jgi:hypothetical protein
MVMHLSIHSMLFHAQASAYVNLVPMAVMLVGCKTGYPHVLKSKYGLKNFQTKFALDQLNAMFLASSI